MSTLPDQPKLPTALSVGLAIGVAVVAWIIASTILGFLFTIVKLTLVVGAVLGVIWLTSKGND